MKIQPTFIDIMRHGEPEGSCPQGGTILRGSTDHPLTEKGWLQAEARCQRVIDDENRLPEQQNKSPWDVVVSSPLIRCAEFAKSLHESLEFSANAKHESFMIKPNWREIHYGDWDGQSTADIWQQQPELMEKMWKDPLEFCAPKGESVKIFSQRLQAAWLELLVEFQGKRILLVCHGGVMRVLLQQLLMMSPEGMNRFAIPYAAMTRFRIDHSLVDDNVNVGSVSDEGSINKNSNRKNIQHWPSLLSHYSDDLTE